MSKSRITQASAEFFKEGIVNYFEAEKIEYVCSMKAIKHRSRKFANNAVPKKAWLFPFGEIHYDRYKAG